MAGLNMSGSGCYVLLRIFTKYLIYHLIFYRSTGQPWGGSLRFGNGLTADLEIPVGDFDYLSVIFIKIVSESNMKGK